MTAGRVDGETQIQDITGYNCKRWVHCPSPLSPYLETSMDRAIEGEGTWVKAGETTRLRFHLGFSKHPLS